MFPSINKDIDINRKEVYRYLGYKGENPEPDMAAKIEDCIAKVKEASELRGMYQVYPLAFHGEDCFSLGSMIIRSKDLAKNLEGCMDAYVMGTTIGVGIDRLIARAEITDIASAAIYQAVGAAYIEDYCDLVNEEIKGIAEEQGLSTRPRFSPGYGDFGLEYQVEIFNLLNLPKHVGISLSDSLIMTPSKSVTAIIGVKEQGSGAVAHKPEANPTDANENSLSKTHKCSTCNMTDCPFRQE